MGPLWGATRSGRRPPLPCAAAPGSSSAATAAPAAPGFVVRRYLLAPPPPGSSSAAAAAPPPPGRRPPCSCADPAAAAGAPPPATPCCPLRRRARPPACCRRRRPGRLPAAAAPTPPGSSAAALPPTPPRCRACRCRADASRVVCRCRADASRVVCRCRADASRVVCRCRADASRVVCRCRADASRAAVMRPVQCMGTVAPLRDEMRKLRMADMRCISIFFVEFQAHFGGDYSGTAWIHSLVDCTTMLCGKNLDCTIVQNQDCSAIATRWSSRVSVMLGGLLSSSGLLLSSLRRKALAYGVAMSGSGIGTFLLAPAVQLLIDHYSWRGALLILSAFVANLCEPSVATLLTTSPLPLPGTGITDHTPSTCCTPMRERRLGSCFPSSKDYSFLLLPDFLCLAVSFLGCSLPFVYLVPYALSAGVSSQNAALLMSTLGGVGIVGNITFGWLTDRSCVCVPALRSFCQLLPFSVLYGYFDGAYVALIPVVTSDVVGPAHLPSALGVVYFLHAFPYLLSPPIGGWLVDTTGSYSATFFLSGSALLASSLVISMVALIRHYQRRATSAASPIATKANISKETEALPLGRANQLDCFIRQQQQQQQQQSGPLGGRGIVGVERRMIPSLGPAAALLLSAAVGSPLPAPLVAHLLLSAAVGSSARSPHTP
ncbi:hypothetical protein CRUP_009272 [Coryphaenoides rupestris]|nr:hypothetical protein CRUP_009272 [Coryphaenoides rupestris]